MIKKHQKPYEEYNIKRKSYQNGEELIITKKVPIRYNFVQDTKKSGNSYKKKDTTNLYNSLHRTKTNIIDIAKSNNWEWFITITFDKQKVDRYNYEAVAKKFKKLLNNIKQRKSPDLKYLLVAELHKDGAIHFHGLLSQIGALNTVKTKNKDSSGHDIYNFTDFNLGFTQATKVQNTKAVSTYISKYISLELVVVAKNKHKYWCSKNLERPKETLEYIQEKKITNLNDNLKELCDYFNEYATTIEGVEQQHTTHFYFNSNT